MSCRGFGLKRYLSTADSLRSALRNYPQPVALITAVASHENAQPRGIIVSSLTSLSLNPPLVTFNVKVPSRALSAMHESFVAHILTCSDDHISLARQFSKPEACGCDWHLDQLWETASSEEAPVLKDTATTKLYCTMRQMVNVEDHCIVIGNVDRVHQGTTTDGLVYRNGEFQRVK